MIFIFNIADWGDPIVQVAEIGGAIGRLPEVKEAAVIVRDRRSVGRELVAYVVPEGSFDPDRLKVSLCSILPQSAMPAAFVAVSALPLTAAGEIDEEALARLEALRKDARTNDDE